MTRERRIARVPVMGVSMSGPCRTGTAAKVINVNELGLKDVAEQLRARIAHLERMNDYPLRVEEARVALRIVEEAQHENSVRAEVIALEERGEVSRE